MNVEQQIKEAEKKLENCESKAKSHDDKERCLKQFKIDVLKIKEEKQPKPMINDTDLLLVHRGGVDYKITAAELKAYFCPAKMPWESKDSWIHYKVDGDCSVYNHDGIYRLDGTLVADPETRSTSISEPEFIVCGNNSKVYTWKDSSVESTTNLGTRTSLYEMFEGMDNLKTFEPGPGWDTSNVTNMSRCFYNVYIPQADWSAWDVSNVTDMSQMFVSETYSKWHGTGLSTWVTTNVTNMYDMFEGEEFTDDLSGWDVSNVTNMDYMFYYDSNFDQDLSGWCVTKIPSEPNRFGGSKTWATERKPQWGTCP